MITKLCGVALLIFFLITATSCCLFTKSSMLSARVYVYNHSSYPVTNLYIPTLSDENFIAVLEPGTRGTLLYEMYREPCSNTFYAAIYFTKNGLGYGTVFPESYNEDTPHNRYKPFKYVTDGDTVTVRIYNDRWEW